MILVVDSTDRERLSITKEELHKMMGHDELNRANILVFANKQVRTDLIYSKTRFVLNSDFMHNDNIFLFLYNLGREWVHECGRNLKTA